MRGLEVADFESAADFVRGYAKPDHGCLILDQHLPRVSGLEFLASREGRDLGIPVIRARVTGASPGAHSRSAPNIWKSRFADGRSLKRWNESSPAAASD